MLGKKTHSLSNLHSIRVVLTQNTLSIIFENYLLKKQQLQKTLKKQQQDKTDFVCH